MSITQGAFETLVIASLYGGTALVIAVVRDLIWRRAGDARPRYPSLLGTALLALVFVIPLYSRFRTMEPKGDWPRFSHQLPVVLDPAAARNFADDLLPRLQSREHLTLALAYSGSDLDTRTVQRCLSIELTLVPASPPKPGIERASVTVTLAQTARASVAIEQHLPRLEDAFFLLADIEQCLWLLSAWQPRDEKLAGLRQLDRALGAAPARMHPGRVDTFHSRGRQILNDLAMAESDLDLRRGILKLLTLVPESNR